MHRFSIGLVTVSRLWLPLALCTTAACGESPALVDTPDGSPVTSDGGADEVRCRLVGVDTHAPADGPVFSREVWTWEVDGESFRAETDTDLDGAADSVFTSTRIDATHVEWTTDSGADGTIEGMGRQTLNAVGQLVAWGQTNGATTERCTRTYESEDPTTARGTFADSQQCTGLTGVTHCVFEDGRLVRCERDYQASTFPQDAAPMPDGNPDVITTYARDGDTATVSSDGGGSSCSDGTCVAREPDGVPDSLVEHTFDATGQPELFANGLPVRVRHDTDGDGTWDLVIETDYVDGRWTASRYDTEADGTWDQERIATYECR